MVVNERIKELAEQVYGSAHYDDFKFAELIVNECCRMMVDLEIQYPANLTVLEIKKHFGV
jgi:hypothetical protein